jgi:hypothetical protein
MKNGQIRRSGQPNPELSALDLLVTLKYNTLDHALWLNLYLSKA